MVASADTVEFEAKAFDEIRQIFEGDILDLTLG
jgi:hypothetical protein